MLPFPHANNSLSKLTPREHECLYWFALGKTHDEVASILSISSRTVKAHVRHIKDKLCCYNQFQMGIAYANLSGKMTVAENRN
jgi:DNA-binding CsgD family transcriptional regulator